MTNRLIFMRHGEQIPRGANGDVLCGLTLNGRNEMRKVGESIQSYDTERAYSVGNVRSLESITLAMMPQLGDEKLKHSMSELQGSGRLITDSELQYIATTNNEFLAGVDDAFIAGECLRFHVGESDTYRETSSDIAPSTYSSMAAVVADKILAYEQTSLVCAREFFYPSLRSKLTMMKLGKRALEYYVDYYCSDVEWNPEARQQIQVIARRGDYYRLQDNFGGIEFLMFVLDELADKLADSGKDVIKLTLGKAQEELHPNIINAYVNAIRDPRKRALVYPEGLPELRDKIAEWYVALGNNIDPKNVLINTGTSPFYKDLFRLLIDKGDEILLPQPYYSVYYVCGLLAEANIRFYNVDPKTLRIDLDDLRKKYDSNKTKFIVTCSPGNPFGNIISSEEYREIVSLVSDYTYIISDEIYRNTGFNESVASILDLDLSSDQKKRIIITNSFSKGFRMYTARVGFSILPDELLGPYRVLLQHTLLATNPAEQFACIEALNHLGEVDDLVKVYKSRNDYAVKRLADCRDVNVIPAEGGFYLVMTCGKFMENHDMTTSFDLAKDLLEKTGVAVVPGSDFGVPDGVRVSFTHLRYNEGIDRMAEYFSK